MSTLFVPLRGLTPREITRCRRKKHGRKTTEAARQWQTREIMALLHDKQIRQEAYEARCERPQIALIKRYIKHKNKARLNKQLASYYTRLNRRRRPR